MAFNTPSNQRTQRKPRKLDRAKVVELAEQGLKTVDIAKHQGVAPSTIFRFLNKQSRLDRPWKSLRRTEGTYLPDWP